MHLAEQLSLRPLPCAGLLVTLTRKCPLRCAHCSTASSMRGEEPDAAQLRRFVASFTALDRPELILLTGGEPLLRPELAAELADSARTAGTRSALLSGMFFARAPRIPGPVRRAITSVDHFSASLDAFHEREVPREAVFRVLREVLDAGTPVSLHITGLKPGDSYVEDVVAQVRRIFGEQVPMLVNSVRKVGRAAAWSSAEALAVMDGRVAPCAMAAWPVVAFDGSILACCSQDTVDVRPVPAHLALGHIADTDWSRVRERALGSPLLRMIRAVGPVHLYERYGSLDACAGYCEGCRSLGSHPALVEAVTRDGSGPVGALLDLAAAGHSRGPASAVSQARRYGNPDYAEWVAAGFGGT
jgi:pyruvate-formate lyase-activating enzyme